MRHPGVLFAFSVLAVGLVWASDAGAIGGVISDLVYDPAGRSIRPVIGVPGAAYLGQALFGGVEAVWLAPGGNRALAAAGGSLYWVASLIPGPPEWRPLPLTGTLPELVAWRPDAGSVAVYAADQVTRIDGDGVIARYPTGSLPGLVAALAVAEDGSVLAGVQGAGLFLLSRDKEPVLLAPFDQPVAIVSAGAGRLLVADRARGEIIELRNWRASPEAVLLAGPSAGVSDPVALALSPDGGTLLVASAAERKVTLLELASAAVVAEVRLDFTPSRLEAFGCLGFLLNERREAGEPLELLTLTPEPALFFIPDPARAPAGVEQ